MGAGKDTKADKLTPYFGNYSSPTKAKDIWDVLRESWERRGTPSFSFHQCTFSWSQAQTIYHHDWTVTIKSSSLLPPQPLATASSWLPPISNYNIIWHSNTTQRKHQAWATARVESPLAGEHGGFCVCRLIRLFCLLMWTSSLWRVRLLLAFIKILKNWLVWAL